ncbi:DNA translocase FtsK, partial [Paracoccus sp. (in: a-proteobacteria)]
EHPPLSLLAAPTTVERHQLSQEALMENARMLEAVLDDYGVKGQITEVRPGPVVTLYELEPAPGLKASRVIGLADDIARSMSALAARVSTVPGRTVIGIELPNARREKVVLREILASKAYGDGTQPLPLALGKDIGGGPVVANLAKMPHLLIAGTTGSGKSVAINTMILSLLYKLSPEECRLIMIDPKMLELSVYDGIPHLLSPVVTDPKKAVVALKWVVGEMEERYRRMSKMGVRNIEGYNGRVREALDKGEMFKRTVQTGFDEDTGEPVFETEEFQPETFPYIV